MTLLRKVFFRRRNQLQSESRVLELLGPSLRERVVSIKPLNASRNNSFIIRTDEETFKAFFCRSRAEANQVGRLLKVLGPKGVGITPGVLVHHGELLVSPWIEGRLLSDFPGGERELHLLDLLTKLHRATAPLSGLELDRCLAGSPYIVRLRERLLGASVWLGRRRVLELEKELAELEPLEIFPSILHVDLTVDNVVITPEGDGLIIDNEALSVGNGRGFDVWHAAESLFSLRRVDRILVFVEKYDDLVPGSTALSYGNYWHGVCWAKKSLKALESGQLYKARKAIKKARALIVS